MSDSYGAPASRLGRLIVSGNRLVCGERIFRCAIGRAGLRHHKVEGDGATPLGSFPLRELLFRPDRLRTVATGLPVRALAPDDGWCDDPGDPRYNRPVRLPYSGRYEALWRDDHLYDIVVVIGYNDTPPIPGKGSAIFLHVAAPDFSPTAGCVALALPDLVEVASRSGPTTLLEVRASDIETPAGSGAAKVSARR